MLVVIAYDITDNRRRTRVANVLDGIGRRVQYSVFEAVIEDERLYPVLRRLEELIVPSEDRVRVYRICETCKRRAVVLGSGEITMVPEVIIL